MYWYRLGAQPGFEPLALDVRTGHPVADHLHFRVYCVEHAAGGRELLGVEVGGDDPGTAALCVEGVAAGAAAEVKDAVTGQNTESREIDG
jgi:hypothetical protein